MLKAVMRGHEYAFNSQRSRGPCFSFTLSVWSFSFRAISIFPRSVCLCNALRFWRHLAPSSGTRFRSARRCHPSWQRWRWEASFAEASHVLPMLFLAHSNPTCTSMSAADSSPSGHSTHSHSHNWDLGLETERLDLVIQVCPACVAASSEQV